MAQANATIANISATLTLWATEGALKAHNLKAYLQNLNQKISSCNCAPPNGTDNSTNSTSNIEQDQAVTQVLNMTSTAAPAVNSTTTVVPPTGTEKKEADQEPVVTTTGTPLNSTIQPNQTTGLPLNKTENDAVWGGASGVVSAVNGTSSPAVNSTTTVVSPTGTEKKEADQEPVVTTMGTPLNSTIQPNQTTGLPLNKTESDAVWGGASGVVSAVNGTSCSGVSASPLSNYTVCPSGSQVNGMTRQCGKLYVICNNTKTIAVLNATTFAPLSTIIFGGSNPTYITSCNDTSNSCNNVTLYVSDANYASNVSNLYMVQDIPTPLYTTLNSSFPSDLGPLYCSNNNAAPTLYTCSLGKAYQIFLNDTYSEIPTPTGTNPQQYITNASVAAFTDPNFRIVKVSLNATTTILYSLSMKCAGLIPNPVYMTWAPSDRLIVADKSGSAYLVSSDLSDCCYLGSVANAWRISFSEKAMVAYVASQNSTDIQVFSVSCSA
jgi:hypothetical protein